MTENEIDGAYKSGNEMYNIEISDPLIRGGVKISTKVSGRYLVKTMHYMLQCARKFNVEQDQINTESEFEKKSLGSNS